MEYKAGMKPIRIFISSAQKEFAGERAVLRDYLRGDVLLRRFFEAFLFEEVPAADRRSDEVYLDEVERCDIYVGLFGNEYGFEDAQGVSPTESEFDLATQRHKHRLIFVKGADDRPKHPKMQALIRRTGAQVIRRRFATSAELITGVYAALVQYLETKQLIRSGPFDAAICAEATLADLSNERIRRFVNIARRARGFPLAEDTTPQEVLEHLHLLRQGRPTHAAVLLFGDVPQRFLISSEIKCAHFHGTEVRKPIPSYQVYKGTVFELVDQAADFVLSKINLAVGTRAESTQAPVAYEMPPEVVREAIVNAVAHRDYTSSGSVQVMLFSDRLEVWNPGTLPPSLTLAQLRQPHGSVPGNPLLAEPLYLTQYIERMGTGTGDMIERCRKVGLPEPEFKLTDGFVTILRRQPERAFAAVGGGGGGQVTPPVTPPVAPPVTPPLEVLVRLLGQVGALGNAGIRVHLGLKDRTHLRERYLDPALAEDLIEPTIPDKPTSRLQQYRLTVKGAALLASLRKRDPA
jgi:ATP-dependent DNA helicase RecG